MHGTLKPDASADIDAGNCVSDGTVADRINRHRGGLGIAIMDADFWNQLFATKSSQGISSDEILHKLCRPGCRTLIIPEEVYSEMFNANGHHWTIRKSDKTKTGFDIAFNDLFDGRGARHLKYKHGYGDTINKLPNGVDDAVRCYESIDKMLAAGEVDSKYGKGGIVIVRCLPTWRVQRTDAAGHAIEAAEDDRREHTTNEEGVCRFPAKTEASRPLEDGEIQRKDSATGKGDMAIVTLVERIVKHTQEREPRTHPDIRRTKKTKPLLDPIFPIFSGDNNLKKLLTSEVPVMPEKPITLEGQPSPVRQEGLLFRMKIPSEMRPIIINHKYDLIAGMCHYGEMPEHVWSSIVADKTRWHAGVMAHKASTDPRAGEPNAVDYTSIEPTTGIEQHDRSGYIASWLMQTDIDRDAGKYYPKHLPDDARTGDQFTSATRT